MQEHVQNLGAGIYCIDTGFQRAQFDAAYLIVEDGRAAFVDTGTNHAVPRLLAALDQLGLARDAVDWVMPTHVHLDHAGGVGLLLQSLPQARALIHPRGARHLIDPSALWQGALAVYSEAEMQRSYGELVAVPAKRVVESFDEMAIQVGTRELLLIDTPGHARHHHCIWDARSQGWFTGDTFGLSYREFDTALGPFILPTSTPVQFDPPALLQSMTRLLARQPQAMYLTHYGAVHEPKRLSVALESQIQAMVDLATSLRDTADRHQALKQALSELYLSRLQAHGCTLPLAAQRALLVMDVELNAQGLGVWLDKTRA
jgi:glyoxylase-like metal-dependent hydrolase (beta-lactamase superfamily II)